jgi:O-antigen ligase
MKPGDRLALGGALLLFLVVGDTWFPPGSPWPTLRLPILVVAALTSLRLVARRPELLRALARPPMVFFLAFAVLDLAAAFLADAPRVALRYGVGYLVVAGVAVATAGVFSERTLVRGLMATVLLKVAVSLAVAAWPFAWWWPGPRFQGALGSPNPMGAAAGLAYVLLMLHGWYDWRSARSRWLLVAVGLLATATLAATHSASATAATLAALALAAPLGALRKEAWRGRLAWVAVAVALLAPPLLVASDVGGGGTTGGKSPSATALELRVRWWGMLAPAIVQRPWFGYGAGSTPSLALSNRPPWGTSAHNLYLEAAIYAGIPAAAAILLFVAGGLVLAVRGARREKDGRRAGLVAVMTFYGVLSLVEPVVLNGAPSSLVVPLVAAAVCARPGLEGREGR